MFFVSGNSDITFVDYGNFGLTKSGSRISEISCYFWVFGEVHVHGVQHGVCEQLLSRLRQTVYPTAAEQNASHRSDGL